MSPIATSRPRQRNAAALRRPRAPQDEMEKQGGWFPCCYANDAPSTPTGRRLIDGPLDPATARYKHCVAAAALTASDATRTSVSSNRPRHLL